MKKKLLKRNCEKRGIWWEKAGLESLFSLYSFQYDFIFKVWICTALIKFWAAYSRNKFLPKLGAWQEEKRSQAFQLLARARDNSAGIQKGKSISTTSPNMYQNTDSFDCFFWKTLRKSVSSWICKEKIWKINIKSPLIFFWE